MENSNPSLAIAVPDDKLLAGKQMELRDLSNVLTDVLSRILLSQA